MLVSLFMTIISDHPLLKRSPSIPIAIVAAIIVGGSVAVVVLFVVFGLLCLICHSKYFLCVL